MRREFLTPSYPAPKLNVEQSLGVNITTNIQLVDSFINGSATPSKWIQDISGKLPENIIEDLHLLRTVFAHGVILREYYIKKNDRLNQDWSEFIGWWKDMSEKQVLELLIYGIRETMNFYYKYLPPMPSVENIMKEVSLEDKDLIDPINRRQAIKAVLESWSVEEIEEMLPMYEDLTFIKKRINRLLEGFWMTGFGDLWTQEKVNLSKWEERSQDLLSKAYPTNDEALFEVTGLYPDTNEMEKLLRTEKLTFIPVANLGRMLAFFDKGHHIYVMFEPLSNKADRRTDAMVNDIDDVYPAFEGLGYRTRLEIINLLTKNGEMFAQQIVNQLDMKQSTVSRHLNQLQRSGLVSIRQDGNTKYFSVNRDELKKVLHVLEAFLT